MLAPGCIALPSYYERDPCIGIVEQDHVGVMDLNERHEIVQDNLLRPFKRSLMAIEDLDTGDLSGKVGISLHLDLHRAKWNFKVGREPGFVSVSTRKEISLSHVSLILPDVHIVKLGRVVGLDLYLLGLKACSVFGPTPGIFLTANG